MSTDSVVHTAEAASSKGKVPAQSRRERVVMEEDLDLEMSTDSVVSTAEAAASKGKAPAGSTRGRTALSAEPTTAHCRQDICPLCSPPLRTGFGSQNTRFHHEYIPLLFLYFDYMKMVSNPSENITAIFL